MASVRASSMMSFITPPRNAEYMRARKKQIPISLASRAA
jgi:hypothetical protein